MSNFGFFGEWFHAFGNVGGVACNKFSGEYIVFYYTPHLSSITSEKGSAIQKKQRRCQIALRLFDSTATILVILFFSPFPAIIMAAVVSLNTSIGNTMADTSVGDPSGGVDERVVAQAALEAAEDALESLCAQHAGTFVAVEKRSQALQSSLTQLTQTLTQVNLQVQQAQTHVGHAQQLEASSTTGVAEESTMDPEDNDNDPDAAIAQLFQNRPSLAELSEKHRVRRRTLLQHSALLELLELPSLMDACVRSNLYEEALSIAGLANTLERNHTTNNKHINNNNDIVALVIAQIRSRQTDLQRHLLQRLEGSVTMPDCLEVVTALRRLNSILMETTNNANNKNNNTTTGESLYQSMETQLQIEFLEARNVWLDSTTMATASFVNNHINPSSSSTATAEDLLDLIERYRTRVFEIATQFHAIFRVNSSAGSNNTSSTTDLLALWTARRIQAFLAILQTGLQTAAAHAEALATTTNANTSSSSTHLVSQSSTTSQQQQQQQQYGAATLRDLLEATLFFSSSMGRLGADFTSYQIPQMFEDALCQWIAHSVWTQQGVKPFQQVLQLCCIETQIAAPLVSTTLRHVNNNKHQSKSSSPYVICWTQESSEQIQQALSDFHLSDTTTNVLEQPPGPLRIWMQVPPLGRLVNAILSGLNELRRCLLPSVVPRLEHALEEDVLQVVSRELKQIERQLITTPKVPTALRELISKEYVPLWNQLAVPFVRASFWTAIGREAKAMEYYRQVQSAIDGLVQEKKAAEEALLEKQRQEEAEDDQDAEEAALQEEDAGGEAENEGNVEESDGNGPSEEIATEEFGSKKD